MTTRYVDVDAELDGDGTTAGLTGANCAYKSLNIAEAALPATLTDAWEIICGSAHANHTADTTETIFSGVTTSAANYIDVYASVAGRHSGVWSNSKYRLVVSGYYDAGILSRQVGYCNFRFLQIKNTGESVANVGFKAAAGVGLLDSCLVICNTTGLGYAIYANGGDITCFNCVAYNSTIGFRAHYGGLVVDNCNSCGHGSLGMDIGDYASITATNCYSGGNSGNDFHASVSATTCASEDGTKGATVAYSTSSGAYFTNITPGSEDFHIKSTPPDDISELIGAGTDLSGTFTLDIDGETRVAWDIGADEYISSVAQYSITGAVTVGTTISTALDYTRNASIAGAVTVTATVSSVLAYNIHPQITGAVTVTPIIASTMASAKAYLLDGVISVTPTVAATLDYNRNAAIAGAVTVNTTISSALSYNRHAALNGAVSLGLSVASGMQYSLYGAGDYAITGAITVALNLASALDYTRNASIAGQVEVVTNIAGVLAYNRNSNIVGVIPVDVLITGSPIYNRHASLLGSCEVSPLIASTLLYNHHEVFVGDVEVGLLIASPMQFHSPAHVLNGDIEVSITLLSPMLYSGFGGAGEWLRCDLFNHPHLTAALYPPDRVG